MIRYLNVIGLFLVLTLSISVVNGQKVRNNELSIQVDNDRFAPKSTDRYYSNGLTLQWLRASRDTSFLMFHQLQKLVVTASLHHGIYTPSEITFLESWRHDRPYASTITVSGGVKLLLPKEQLLEAVLSLGITGPAAKGQQLQEWWHDKINIFEPRGWENQIVNSPVATIQLNYSKRWAHADFIDLITHSKLSFGTMISNLKQEGTVRIGKQSALHQSAITGTKVDPGKGKLPFELYFYFTGGLEYVGYNGLIQGNWIGKESPHTELIKRWVLHAQYGIQLSTGMIDASFGLNSLSAEVKGGLNHQYANIKVGFRF